MTELSHQWINSKPSTSELCKHRCCCRVPADEDTVPEQMWRMRKLAGRGSSTPSAITDIRQASQVQLFVCLWKFTPAKRAKQESRKSKTK